MMNERDVKRLSRELAYFDPAGCCSASSAWCSLRAGQNLVELNLVSTGAWTEPRVYRRVESSVVELARQATGAHPGRDPGLGRGFAFFSYAGPTHRSRGKGLDPEPPAPRDRSTTSRSR